jgi:catechol 2,3-dioxygenase-like lactoylglutathione lyase family enzyme
LLESYDVQAMVPAQDLERAKSFYADRLGLKPIEERPEGLRYRCGSGGFMLFQSTGAASGDHTQLGWDVDDLEATVEELRGRGVVFEEYDLPGFKTVNGIAEIAGEKGAWFKDSEGNLLAVGQMTR